MRRLSNLRGAFRFPEPAPPFDDMLGRALRPPAKPNHKSRLGIAEEVDAKAKFIEGTVAEFAAHDSADIVISQPMEILATPSYELVGWLPSELQDYEGFTWAAGITTNSKEPAAAKALVQFLTSPAAAAVIKVKGMEPAAK
jgi:molybdate transport system substrate-binding protein